MRSSEYVHRSLLTELIAERLSQGLDVATLATSTDIPKATLYRIFNGRRRCEVVELVDICAALGVPPELMLRRALRRADEALNQDIADGEAVDRGISEQFG